MCPRVIGDEQQKFSILSLSLSSHLFSLDRFSSQAKFVLVLAGSEYSNFSMYSLRGKFEFYEIVWGTVSRDSKFDDVLLIYFFFFFF